MCTVGDSDGRDLGLDTADVMTLADLVVAILAPVLAPGVLYDPVWLVLQANRSIACRAIAHQQHTMILILTANVRARHATDVELHV